METIHRKEIDELNRKYKQLDALVNQKIGWVLIKSNNSN